jgi:hypothetical protein
MASLPVRFAQLNVSNDGTNWGYLKSAATSHDLTLAAPAGSNIVAASDFYYNNSSDASTSLNTTLDGLASDVSGKEDALTWDSTPVDSSVNPVTSGGLYTALNLKASQSDMSAAESDISTLQTDVAGKYDSADIVDAVTDSNMNAITSNAVYDMAVTKASQADMTAAEGDIATLQTDLAAAQTEIAEIKALLIDLGNPTPGA